MVSDCKCDINIKNNDGKGRSTFVNVARHGILYCS